MMELLAGEKFRRVTHGLHCVRLNSFPVIFLILTTCSYCLGALQGDDWLSTGTDAGDSELSDGSPVRRSIDDDVGDLWSQFADIADGSRTLPPHLVPYHYNLLQQPDIYGEDPSQFTFKGQVEIFISCVETTYRIYLHLGDLDIDNTSLSVEYAADRTWAADVAHIETNSTYQLVCIVLTLPLQYTTSYILRLDFGGRIWEPTEYRRRLYYSSYFFNNTHHYMATTHFSPVDARHAFPCFDEPRFKVTFNISLARQPNMTALSNMHLRVTQVRSDGWVVDHFHTTPLMSTYLVAFIVCDLPYIETTTHSGTKIRIWVPPVYDNASYMLPYAVRILDYMEGVTGISYNLNKLDIVGVPQMDVSAMENWGLITFSISRLVVDIDKDSAHVFVDGFYTMVHELTHTWFGNLVTQESWSQVWLKEAFSSYFQYRVIDALYPAWDARNLHLLDDLHTLDFDARTSANAIMRLIEEPSGQRMIFTLQAYFKGAAMIYMMEKILTRDKFDKMIKSYLHRHQFKTVSPDDLWQAIDEEMNLRNEWASYDAKFLFEPWLTQTGYPLVSMDLLDHGLVRIRQRPMPPKMEYTEEPSNVTNGDKEITPSDDRGGFGNATVSEQSDSSAPIPFISLANRTWSIPLFITDGAATTHVHWIHDEEVVLDLGVHSTHELLTRISYQGFYRINYTQPVWDYLRKALISNHLAFSAASRAHFLSDYAAFVKAEGRSWVEWFKMTEYLWKERDPLVWETYFSIQEISRDTSFNSEDAIQRYIQRLLSGLYLDIGWKTLGIEQYSYRFDLTVEPVLKFISIKRPLDFRDHLLEYWRWSLETGFTVHAAIMGNGRRMQPELKSAMFDYGLKLADDKLWEDTLQYIENECEDEGEELDLLAAMSLNDDRFETYLDYVLESHPELLEDTYYRVTGLMERPEMLWQVVYNASNLTTSLIRKNCIRALIERAVTDDDFAKIEEYMVNPAINETWLNDGQMEVELEYHRQSFREMAAGKGDKYNSTIAWMRQVVEASAKTSQFTSSSVITSPTWTSCIFALIATLRCVNKRR